MCVFSSAVIRTGWSLDCWSRLQDWPNTRWTSGWPETCSWWLKSGSHTDLLETEFPLYLMTRYTRSILASPWWENGALSLAEGGVPLWCQCVPVSRPSRLCVCEGSRDDWERLMSADSCSRLWKHFLQRRNRGSINTLLVLLVSQSTENHFNNWLLSLGNFRWGFLLVAPYQCKNVGLRRLQTKTMYYWVWDILRCIIQLFA